MSENKVGDKLKKFLREKAPKILNKAGEFLPDKGALGIIKNIILTATDQEIDPKIKEEALEIIKQEMEIFEKEIGDRQNARSMQITALQQDDKFSKRFIYFLAAFIILSATGFGVAMTFVEIPEHNRRMIEMFADIYLFAGAMMVLQFFFGSSHSSKRSSETMQKILTDKIEK